MSDKAAATAAHAIMFWVLAGMAFALFAPAVLLPLWEESRELHSYEELKLAEVGRLQLQHDRNALRIEALKNDPMVIERIARRDLNYKPEGEQATQWSPRELASLHVKVPADLLAEPQPHSPVPASIGFLERWLPNWPYHRLFVQMPNRLLMLLMSGGLLVTAFVLYGPDGPSSRKPEHVVTEAQ